MRSNARLATCVAALCAAHLSIAAIALCLLVGSSGAQEVLACYTLHNDLANYDRRARQVTPRYLQEFEAARAASAEQERAAPNDARARPYLWGPDIVRLRIINEMRRYGCPLPREASISEYDIDRPHKTITLPPK